MLKTGQDGQDIKNEAKLDKFESFQQQNCLQKACLKQNVLYFQQLPAQTTNNFFSV